MVASVGKMRGKMAENGFNNRTFAGAMGMSEITLRRKINDPDYEFTIGESLRARDLLHLDTTEYLVIFIGSNLN